MPLYTITTQEGTLDAAAKQTLAAGITDFHAKTAGVPAGWVHIVFHEYPAGNGFSAGRPAATVALSVMIRTGRSPDYKRAFLAELWRLLQSATAAADDQIVVGIQEVPSSQAMEMGRTMPDVAVTQPEIPSQR